MAFTHVTVTATYLKSDGVTPATGTVTFLATGVMRDTSTDISVAPTEQTAVLDENGSISVELIANNDPYTVPTGVSYEVTERIDESAENKYFVSINSNTPDGIADLADLIPNTNPFTTINYATKEYVDSIAGSSSNISFNPTSEIFSTTVQGAIEEVRAISKYVHTQSSANILWDITHNLRFYPNVTVVDSGDNFVVGDVQYISTNRLQVTFTHPFAGKAYIS